MSSTSKHSLPTNWPCASWRRRGLAHAVLLLRVGGLSYLIVVVALVLLENRLVFQARPYPSGDWSAPAPDYEEVYFRSADGTKLHGWFLNHDKPSAHVLYCHGAGDNVGNLGKLVRFLRDKMDVAVFAFDYRGYGRSEGAPDEPGVLADARAARDWLAERCAIAPADVVLMGRSLGGGVAVDLAAELPARGLVLEATFTSLPAAAAVQYPWVPARLLMRNRLNSLSKIPLYDGPLLQSHGDADRIVPLQQGWQLYQAARGPKQFVAIHGADHNDAQSIYYYHTLKRFFQGLQEINRLPRELQHPVAANRP